MSINSVGTVVAAQRARTRNTSTGHRGAGATPAPRVVATARKVVGSGTPLPPEEPLHVAAGEARVRSSSTPAAVEQQRLSRGLDEQRRPIAAIDRGRAMIDPRAQLELIPQLADQEQATGVSQVLRVVGQSEGSGRPLHVGPGLHTMKAHRLGASNVRDEFRQELSLTYGYQAVFVFPSIAGFGFNGGDRSMLGPWVRGGHDRHLVTRPDRRTHGAAGEASASPQTGSSAGCRA